MVGVSSNFDRALGKLGKTSSSFCFTIVENSGVTFLIVQESPCKPQSSTSTMAKINSVEPGEGLFLNGVEIGRFNKSRLEIDSLCSGYYQNTCSLTSGLKNNTAPIKMKNITDQGVVQNLSDKAVFEYQVLDQGTVYEVFFEYRSLDDLVDVATCRAGEKAPSPNFFRNYIKNVKSDQKIFPPSIKVGKSTGKSTGKSIPSLVLDSKGKLQSIKSSNFRF